MTKEQETRLQKLEDEIKALRGELAGAVVGAWRAKENESYVCVSSIGKINGTADIRDAVDFRRHEIGNYFPDTPKGREAAELFAFCEGLRARWKRSADRGPNEYGFRPVVKPLGGFDIGVDSWCYGYGKWSTAEACRAFVDSEGGPERFAEILKRGIL